MEPSDTVNEVLKIIGYTEVDDEKMTLPEDDEGRETVQKAMDIIKEF